MDYAYSQTMLDFGDKVSGTLRAETAMMASLRSASRDGGEGLDDTPAEYEG